MARNSCYTYFVITGSFDPDEATSLLGLTPEKSHRIGDKRPNGTEYDFAAWAFGRCDEYTPYVSEMMERTVAPLIPKIELLEKLREENEVTFYLEIVPTIYAGNSNPCLAPSMAIIDFCHATRTEIDIDMYVHNSLAGSK